MTTQFDETRDSVRPATTDSMDATTRLQDDAYGSDVRSFDTQSQRRSSDDHISQLAFAPVEQNGQPLTPEQYINWLQSGGQIAAAGPRPGESGRLDQQKPSRDGDGRRQTGQPTESHGGQPGQQEEPVESHNGPPVEQGQHGNPFREEERINGNAVNSLTNAAMARAAAEKAGYTDARNAERQGGNVIGSLTDAATALREADKLDPARKLSSANERDTTLADLINTNLDQPARMEQLATNHLAHNIMSGNAEGVRDALATLSDPAFNHCRERIMNALCASLNDNAGRNYSWQQGTDENGNPVTSLHVQVQGDGGTVTSTTIASDGQMQSTRFTEETGTQSISADQGLQAANPSKNAAGRLNR